MLTDHPNPKLNPKAIVTAKILFGLHCEFQGLHKTLCEQDKEAAGIYSISKSFGFDDAVIEPIILRRYRHVILRIESNRRSDAAKKHSHR